MQRMIGTGIAAFAMVMCVAGAQAQTDTRYDETNEFGPAPGDWEFLISGGGTNDKEFEQGNFSLNFEVGNYIVGDELELGVRQAINYADTGDTSWSGSTAVFADYHFDLERFRPFVGVTLGGLYGEDVEETGFAGPEAGVKWYAKDDTFIYGRVAYEFLFESASDVDDTFDDGRLVYTVGIGFNF